MRLFKGDIGKARKSLEGWRITEVEEPDDPEGIMTLVVRRGWQSKKVRISTSHLEWHIDDEFDDPPLKK